MNKKPAALGKGLSALIPSQGSRETPAGRVVQLCALERISSNPYQPRKRFDEQGLAALAETIKEKGVLQPLLVRKAGEGYELIAGERRLGSGRRSL